MNLGALPEVNHAIVVGRVEASLANTFPPPFCACIPPVSECSDIGLILQDRLLF